MTTVVQRHGRAVLPAHAARFSLETLSPPGLHGHPDCEPRRQYRHLDVHGRVELADDEPQSASVDRLARAGRLKPAYLPATVPIAGASSRMRPTPHASSRCFWWIVGSSICASTNGSLMRTGRCRPGCSVSQWRVCRRSRTCSQPKGR